MGDWRDEVAGEVRPFEPMAWVGGRIGKPDGEPLQIDWELVQITGEPNGGEQGVKKNTSGNYQYGAT